MCFGDGGQLCRGVGGYVWVWAVVCECGRLCVGVDSCVCGRRQLCVVGVGSCGWVREPSRSNPLVVDLKSVAR